MRNIYDIISEQKSLVDFNISCYESYYFINEFEYIQEGIGESLKNIANKIIEFIKTIIRNIKELLGKMFGFFKSRDEKVKNLDNKIKEANKEYERKLAKENKHKSDYMKQFDDIKKEQQEREKQYENERNELDRKYKEDVENLKKEREERERQRQKEKDDYKKQIEEEERKLKEQEQEEDNVLGIKLYGGLIELLDNSTLSFRGKNYGSIEKRERYLNKLISCVSKCSSSNVSLNDLRNNSIDLLRNNLTKLLFGKIHMSDNMIQEAFLKEVGDGEDDTAPIKLRSVSHIIDDYCTKGSQLMRKIQRSANELIGELNDMISVIETNANNTSTRLNDNKNNTEKTVDDYDKLARVVQRMANLSHSLFTTLLKTTTAAYNQYTSIALKVSDRYFANLAKETGRKYGE